MRGLRYVLLFLCCALTACGSSGDGDAGSAPDDFDASEPGGTRDGSTASDGGGELPCAADLANGLEWPQATSEVPLAGSLELGQTHIIGTEETRLAPRLLAGRAALVLFAPDVPIEGEAPVLVGAFDGEAHLGTLPLAPPTSPPPLLEATLTDVPLEPYRDDAWSAQLPWSWVQDGVELRIGQVRDGVRHVFRHRLESLAPPHRLTVTRTKIVLFGEPTFDTSTQPASRIAADYFAVLPVATLRFVDSAPWRLDEIVVETTEGARMVRSEAELDARFVAEDHWRILKHQLALRSSLANTGRGLVLTGEAEGDNSPYSFGTSVGMGWFRETDGQYRDIDDAPWAAGWTGWTAMWTDECGNAFTHEVGHSATLQHFVSGTAARWGIEDEYPQEGTYLASHPWGYDTVRRRVRAWYRVGPSGPVIEGGSPVGIRDPMNGGESANAVTCFPPYTAYHADQIQRWIETTPTLAEVDGAVGAYLWDTAAARYRPAPIAPEHQAPVALDVPVLTLVGTLGNDDEACQTYPPIHTPSGNVFSFPDPAAEGLDLAFEGARWFLVIRYEDGAAERALIASDVITDNRIGLYSVNVDGRRSPTEVQLWRSPTPYPTIDVDGAELVHTRSLDATPTVSPPVVHVGAGALGASRLVLRDRCEPEINCEDRQVEAAWRRSDAQLHFAPPGVESTPRTCAERGEWTRFTLTATDETGTPHDIVVEAQRIVRAGGREVAVPLEDVTAWLAGHDLEQGLRVRMPWEPNQGLPTGRYRNPDGARVEVLADGSRETFIELDLDIEVLDTTEASLPTPPGEVFGPAYTSPASSIYFLTRDASVGPVTRVWWDDGIDGPTRLSVPMVSPDGEVVRVAVNAQQEECGRSRYDLNAGRGAGECEHRAVLTIAPDGNEGLTSGERYQTPASAPLVLEARRWHDPGARQLLGVFAFRLSYTAP